LATEVSPDAVYSCSAAPGTKEILYSVNVNGKDLSLATNSELFGDYSNANHLYLTVNRNVWGECVNSHQVFDLDADWSLTR
jgi:hypothetical protein